MTSPQDDFPLAIEGPSGPAAFVDEDLIERVAEGAQRSPRNRLMMTLHSSVDDPLQRMLNALQPGSYVRPHRHATADSFVLIKGRVACILFSDDGNIEQIIIIDRDAGRVACDVRPGTFHTLVPLQSNSVMFEVRPGPYDPATAKEPASWAPEEGSPEAAEYLEHLERKAQGGIGA